MYPLHFMRTMHDFVIASRALIKGARWPDCRREAAQNCTDSHAYSSKLDMRRSRFQDQCACNIKFTDQDFKINTNQSKIHGWNQEKQHPCTKYQQLKSAI